MRHTSLNKIRYTGDMKASKELRARAKQLQDTITKYRALQHEKDLSPISPEALDLLKYDESLKVEVCRFIYIKYNICYI